MNSGKAGGSQPSLEELVSQLAGAHSDLEKKVETIAQVSREALNVGLNAAIGARHALLEQRSLVGAARLDVTTFDQLIGKINKSLERLQAAMRDLDEKGGAHGS